MNPRSKQGYALKYGSIAQQNLDQLVINKGLLLVWCLMV